MDSHVADKMIYQAMIIVSQILKTGSAVCITKCLGGLCWAENQVDKGQGHIL